MFELTKEERQERLEWWGERDEALSCPACGSLKFRMFDENDYACTRCGHFFTDAEMGGTEMEELPRETAPINGVPRTPAWMDDAVRRFFALPINRGEIACVGPIPPEPRVLSWRADARPDSPGSSDPTPKPKAKPKPKPKQRPEPAPRLGRLEIERRLRLLEFKGITGLQALIRRLGDILQDRKVWFVDPGPDWWRGEIKGALSRIGERSIRHMAMMIMRYGLYGKNMDAYPHSIEWICHDNGIGGEEVRGLLDGMEREIADGIVAGLFPDDAP